MRTMKDSGIEWIGEIPEEWALHRIKNNFKIVSGSGFNVNLQGNDDGEIPVCKASDISIAGHYLKSAANYLSHDDAVNNGFSIIPVGSILFPKIGEAMRKNRRTLTSVSCCADNNCQAIVPANIDSNYSYYMMLCVDSSWFDNNGTIPCMNNSKFLNFRFPFPPLSEQRRIADFLDAKCADIDRLSAVIQSEIDTLEQYKRSVITEAVTKGLDPDVEMKDSGIEWIGEIPKEWEFTCIKYVATLHGRIGWQGLTSAEYTDDGAYLITGVNFHNGKIDWSSCVRVPMCRWEEDKKIQIENGDLLITKDGTVGKVAMVEDCNEPTSLNSGVLRICTSGICHKRFLYWVLQSDEFYHWFAYKNAGNSTILHLYQGDFADFKYGVPSLSEQRRIADFLDAKCSRIDALIAKEREKLTVLDLYKKSLIYEYVTGKKEVPLP